jgi:hypothetical protein
VDGRARAAREVVITIIGGFACPGVYRSFLSRVDASGLAVQHPIVRSDRAAFEWMVANSYMGRKRGSAKCHRSHRITPEKRATGGAGQDRKEPFKPVRGEFIKSRGDRRLVQSATVLLRAIRGKAYRRRSAARIWQLSF